MNGGSISAPVYLCYWGFSRWSRQRETFPDTNNVSVADKMVLLNFKQIFNNENTGQNPRRAIYHSKACGVVVAGLNCYL
jgi:hypothetical protein